MVVSNTPIEYYKQYGLYVKREDLSCPAPGPPFSKARGVFARVKSRPENLIGVLDTSHSQAGWAVARACQVLGKKCINYYPVYKQEIDDYGQHELRTPQVRSKGLGASLHSLQAGRSCILYHAAKKDCELREGYMMPNALKLNESVTETALEVPNENYDWVIVPASGATIASGVVKGFFNRHLIKQPKFIIHLGYSRSLEEVSRYLREMSGVAVDPVIIDEKYSYKDKARTGETPPWPCNAYYDLKAFRWWLGHRSEFKGRVLFWNIG